MEPVTITTPSGYKVTFKPFVSFGDKRRIQRVFMASAKINPKDPDDIEFDAASMYDAQDLAVKLLVEGIDVPGFDKALAKTPDEILATIQEWPQEDGQAVYDKINDLTRDTMTPQKKGS